MLQGRDKVLLRGLRGELVEDQHQHQQPQERRRRQRLHQQMNRWQHHWQAQQRRGTGMAGDPQVHRAQVMMGQQQQVQQRQGARGQQRHALQEQQQALQEQQRQQEQGAVVAKAGGTDARE